MKHDAKLIPIYPLPIEWQCYNCGHTEARGTTTTHVYCLEHNVYLCIACWDAYASTRVTRPFNSRRDARD